MVIDDGMTENTVPIVSRLFLGMCYMKNMRNFPEDTIPKVKSNRLRKNNV